MADTPVEALEPLEKKNPNATSRKKSNFKPGRGGKRRGAGRKKGTKNVKTLLKEEAAEHLAKKAHLKQEILNALPHRLQMSDKALKEAIKEINEEEIEELFKKRVALHSNSLLTAMLSVAQGEQYLYKVVEAVDTTGKVKRKHVMVTDPQEIANYLDNPLEAEGSDYFYIATKSPDVTAINSLFDRFMGRVATKVVGPDNPDGSEGAIKVISVNYAQPAQAQAPVVTEKLPVADSPALPAETVVEEVIKDVIEEENGN